MELAPLAAAVLRRPPALHPRAWIAAWGALMFLTDAVMRGLGSAGIHNLWVFYILAPVHAAALFWALSLWQSGQLPRLTLRAAIPVFALAWVSMVLLFEDPNAFSFVALPVYAVLGLTAAVGTLILRSTGTTEPLPSQDWFWVCSGVALYFSGVAALGPIGLLLREHPRLVFRALEVKSYLQILGFLVIAKGLMCPLPTPSGASSSPAPSASRSLSSLS